MKELINKCKDTPEKHVEELKDVVERATKIGLDNEEVRKIKSICEQVVRIFLFYFYYFIFIILYFIIYYLFLLIIFIIYYLLFLFFI